MNKNIKLAAAALFLSAGLSTAASANSITAWSCEATDSGQTVKLTTQSNVSASAVVNIDGVAQSASPTISGTNVSLSIPTSTQCWAVQFTITDGGTTFGLN